MKKTILFLIITITIISSCKSSKANCDAYGCNQKPKKEIKIL
jgi:hypothetical protein